MGFLIATAVAVAGSAATVPVAFGSLLRRVLPAPKGPFAVASYVRRDAAGFLVRVWYPVEGLRHGEAAAQAQWLPPPPANYFGGLMAYLGLPWLLVKLALPAVLGVRGRWSEETAAAPSALAEGAGARVPVVVFSHSMIGTQTMHSMVCVELASQGHVVVVPEHTDGSAGVTMRADGTALLYQNKSVGISKDELLAVRREQFSHRQSELIAALRSLLEGAAAAGSPWHGRLDAGRVAVAGHSMGGGSAMAAAVKATDGASLGMAGFSGFCCGVVLDGWMFPLAGATGDVGDICRDFGSGPAAAEALPPLLFVDCEAWLDDWSWRRSKVDLVRHCSAMGRPSALLTLRHSVHYTFSDVLTLGSTGFALYERFFKKRKDAGSTLQGVDVEQAPRKPSSAALSAEAAEVCADFIAAHCGERIDDSACGRAAAAVAFTEKLRRRMPRIEDRYFVLAASPEFCLPQNSPVADGAAARSKL